MKSLYFRESWFSVEELTDLTINTKLDARLPSLKKKVQKIYYYKKVDPNALF